MSTDLLKQIDELVSSKTFSLDALEGIKKIKDGLEQSEEIRKKVEKRLEELCAASERRAEEVVSLKSANKQLSEELAAVKGGIAKGKEAVWEKMIAEAKANAYQDALYTVFKPSAVRETVQRSVGIPIAGSPGGNGYSPSAGWVAQTQEAETITKEQI